MSRLVSIAILFTLLPSVHATAALSEQKAEDHTILRQECIIPAPVDEVWNLWTTQEGIEKWLAPRVKMDFRVGGSWRASYNPQSTLDDEHTIENTILAFEPQRMLAFRCTRAPQGFPFLDQILNMWSVVYFEPIGPDRTRLISVGLGYTDDPKSQQMRRYFEVNNPIVFNALIALAGEAEELKNRDVRTLELLDRLAGGEWIHESSTADGEVFRVRNVIRYGPDGRSLVSDSWFTVGDDSFQHGHTLLQQLPATHGGGVGFVSVNESGQYAHGTVILGEGDDTVVYDWRQIAPDGEMTVYRIETQFEGSDQYIMRMQRIEADDTITDLRTMTFTRTR